MSSKESGDDASPSPTRSFGKGLYIPPAQRRQMLAEQELAREQKQKQVQEIKMGGDEDDGSSRRVDLSLRPSVGCPKAGSEVTNLGRFLESVTPYISARSLLEGNAKDGTTVESDLHSYYCLSDLWEYFGERSAYGAAVTLLLNGKDPVEQYYVPYLSGMQLYTDKPSSIGLPEEKHDGSHISQSTSGYVRSETDQTTESALHSSMHQMDNLSLADISSVDSSISRAGAQSAREKSVFFHFLECEPPHSRKPLTDKVSDLASRYPELIHCKSCDLLPTSWICVAWYPIYRIPLGPTMKDLDTCFLTFHALSTQSKTKFPPKFHAPNSISLPVFGLTSYKPKGSALSTCAPQEYKLENSLLQSAHDWLQHLQVELPDYRFFRDRHFNGR